MARQQPLPPESILSTDLEHYSLPVDSMETTLLELEARASKTTAVLQEILAREEDRYYVHHWGINE